MGNTNSTRIANAKYVLAILFLTLTHLVPGKAMAQVPPDVLVDSFTSVRMFLGVPEQPFNPEQVTTLNNPSVLSFTQQAPSFATPGDISGFGRAEFGSLGASFVMTGAGAQSAIIEVRAHEVLTVAAPLGVANGTPGSMTFVYSIDGSTFSSVNLGAQAVPSRSLTSTTAGYGLSMFSFAEQLGPIPIVSTSHGNHFVTTLTYGEAVTRAGGGAGDPTIPSFTPALNFNVPFFYGEPLPLSVKFQIQAELDRTLSTTVNPFQLLSTEHILDELSMDFSNTAALLAIVNEDYPDVQITSSSNADYSSLVTDTFPTAVPIPPAIWLIASALAMLPARTRRVSGDKLNFLGRLV